MAGLPLVGAQAVVQNLPGFKSAMNAVNKSLNDAASASDNLASRSSGLQKALSSVASVGLGAVAAAAAVATAAIAATTAAFAAFVVQGIKTNSTLEQLQIQLDKTVGSGEETLAWVREISKTTPFTAEQLATTIATAGAYGFTADEAKRFALLAGDVQAVMSTQPGVMDRVIRALGQMQARTKVAASEMLQLTELGIPAWKLLADNMGITVGELQDLVSKGMVPAADAIPVLASAIEDKFGGAMEEQSRTAKGLFETIGETIQLMAADVTAPAFDALKVILQDIASFLDSETFMSWIDNATKAMSDLVDNIGSAFATLSEGDFATKLLPAIGDAIKALIGEGAAPDFSWIGALADGINRLSGPLAEIVTALAGGDIWGALGIATGGNENIMGFFAGLATAIKFVTSAITALVEALVTTLGPSFQGIFDELTGILADFGLNWGDVWEAIKKALTIVVGIIAAVLATLLGIVTGIVSGIAAALHQSVKAWREILPHIQGVVEGIIKVVVGLWQFIVKVFQGDIPGAMRALEVAAQGVFEIVVNTFKGIIDAAKGGFAVIIGFAAGFVAGIVEFFQGLYDKLIGHSIITDMINGIFGAFEDLSSKGLGIFQGFTDGIFNIAEGLIGKVTGLFTNLTGGIVGALTGGGQPAPGGQAAPPAAGGAQPEAEGAPGGGGPLAGIVQTITRLKTEFSALMTTVQTQLTEFLATIGVSFQTLLETAVLPFVTAMQQISTWIIIGVDAFEGLAKSIRNMSTAFTAFRFDAVMSIMSLITSTKEQFNLLNLFMEEWKGIMARHWLDYVVAVQSLTAQMVEAVIGAFQRLADNVSVSSDALTMGFESSMDAVQSKVNSQLQPTLIGAGGAFKGLANAAISAAREVASAAADICDAVTAAYECATASPELVIQHPFEGFEEYLKKSTPVVQSLIGKMVDPLDQVSGRALGITQDMGILAKASENALQGMSARGGMTEINNTEINIGPNQYRQQEPVSMIDDLAIIGLLSG